MMCGPAVASPSHAKAKNVKILGTAASGLAHPGETLPGNCELTVIFLSNFNDVVFKESLLQ